MNKQNMLKIIFAVWIVLWIFFLVREDKSDQYRELRYLYAHNSAENARYIAGEDLYDFLVFCKDNIPTGFTYRLSGFQKFSIDEMRARYFLWPLKSIADNPDFIIVYGGKGEKVPGYKVFMKFDNKGCILERRT